MMLALAFFFTLAVTVVAVMAGTRTPGSRKNLQARLAVIAKRDPNKASDAITLAAKAEPSFTDRISDKLRTFGFGANLETLLIHAGSSSTAGKIVLFSLGSSALAALIAYHFLGTLWMWLLAGFLGAFLPYFFLCFKRGRRLGKFNDALADSIDLMSRALKAGHSVGSAIEIVSEQSPEPLSGEFGSCFQQQKFGIPFRDALLAMGERIPSQDLQFLITAVLVQKETGGDLTDILDRTARLIRERIRIQGEIKTYTAQGRLTGWILGSLPIVLLCVTNIITPGYASIMFTDPMGKLLIGGGAVFIIIGGLIIRKIVDIKV